jgi:hypothetical protein
MIGKTIESNLGDDGKTFYIKTFYPVNKYNLPWRSNEIEKEELHPNLISKGKSPFQRSEYLTKIGFETSKL